MTEIETQTNAGHVTIGPRFFETAIKDYENPHWAFVREIMQNSIDAGSRTIHWKFAPSPDGGLTVTITDDGCGMNRDILVNKLLELGGSGKEFRDGAVGGFGKAKELLLFSQRSYRIETHNLILEGSGADYTLADIDDFGIDGTVITVHLHPKFDKPQLLRERIPFFSRLDFIRIDKVGN